MDKKAEAMSWRFNSELADYFTPYMKKEGYDERSLDDLYRQYDLVNDESASLIKDLLGRLSDFAQLMRPNNQRLVDKPAWQQDAHSLFAEVDRALDHLKPLQSKSPDIYLAAEKYTKNLVAFHVDLLEKYEPDSIALKWYKEWPGSLAS